MTEVAVQLAQSPFILPYTNDVKNGRHIFDRAQIRVLFLANCAYESRLPVVKHHRTNA